MLHFGQSILHFRWAVRLGLCPSWIFKWRILLRWSSTEKPVTVLTTVTFALPTSSPQNIQIIVSHMEKHLLFSRGSAVHLIFLGFCRFFFSNNRFWTFPNHLLFPYIIPSRKIQFLPLPFLKVWINFIPYTWFSFILFNLNYPIPFLPSLQALPNQSFVVALFCWLDVHARSRFCETSSRKTNSTRRNPYECMISPSESITDSGER